MTIRSRLLLMAGVSIILSAIIGTAGLIGVSQLSESTQAMRNTTEILRNHLTADMMHDALSSDVMGMLVASDNNNRPAMETAIQDRLDHAATFRDMLSKNRELISNDEISGALNAVVPALNDYIEASERIVSVAQEDYEQALALVPGFREAYDQLAVDMESLTNLIERDAATVESNAAGMAGSSRNLLIGSMALSIALMTVICWLTSARITSALDELVQGSRNLAKGDLATPFKVKGNDEIAKTTKSLEAMRGYLASMIGEILSSAERLNQATSTMNEASENSRSTVADQQSEISQVATAMQEMSATAQDVANNIAETASSASEAHQESISGGEVISKTETEIQGLADQIEEASKVIDQLNDDSVEIGEILDVIQGVAEQTNLLALNAAIEAARAGEQGRGFAVVADEVRTLAGKTQKSTEKIKDTIDKLDSGSKSAVQAMEQSRSRASTVVRQAVDAGESLSAISRSVARINDMSTQIASASEQQSSVAEDMTKSLEGIDTKSQDVTASLEETARAVNDVSQTARELETAVARFKLA